MKRFLGPLFSLAICAFSGALTANAQSTEGEGYRDLPSTVAKVSLPEIVLDQAMTNFTAAVTTSPVDAKNKIVGFQGDFTFDERVITFQNPPVQRAGITNGNWNVSGNVLPGTGPIRTLRISAFATDFTSLSGSGPLFELRLTRVGKADQSTKLTWAPAPDHFFFIDADLNTQKPSSVPDGGANPGRRK